jgi:hypothetical protein
MGGGEPSSRTPPVTGFTFACGYTANTFRNAGENSF